jgi:hypothetical protein
MKHDFEALEASAKEAARSMEKPAGYKWPKDEFLGLPPHYCLRTYIAAASPEAVLDLTQCVREVEAERDMLRKLLSDAISCVPSGYAKRRLNLKFIQID